MRILALFCSIFILFSAADAQANAKPWIWSWWPSHWHNQDFKAYMEDPKAPHNVQWQSGLYPGQQWHPQNWIDAEGSIRNVMDGFYDNDIIKSQDVDGDMPVLIVGDGFMRLSGQDQRRVTDFIDYVYQVTTTAPAGMYTIYYDRTHNWVYGRGNPVAMYTDKGLSLQ